MGSRPGTGSPQVRALLRCRQISKRLQVFYQIVFLRIGESKAEMVVVVVDDIHERGEPPVVIEAAFMDLAGVPESPQRGSPVGALRRPFGLEVVDADLLDRKRNRLNSSHI